MGRAEKRFDFHADKAWGERWERKWKDVFRDGAVMEVKSDRLWYQTGNVVFEIKCNGERSGLTATEADYWLYSLPNMDDEMDLGLLIRRRWFMKDRLPVLIERGDAVLVPGGEGGRARMYKVPLLTIPPVSERNIIKSLKRRGLV